MNMTQLLDGRNVTAILEPYHCPFAPWRPDDGRIFNAFSFATGATGIDFEQPYLVPQFVLGAACDGQRGILLTPQSLLSFFVAHEGVPIVCHDAAFDLKVAQSTLGAKKDVYAVVEQGLVWDTSILHRLHSLATVGHTASGEAQLDECARSHLGLQLSKDPVDAQGRTMHLSFSPLFGKPLPDVPEPYLQHLGQRALAIWHLGNVLLQRIDSVLRSAQRAFGFVSWPWLEDMRQRFGPLTHHIQLRASIVTDVLNSTGIAIDRDRRDEKARLLRADMDACKDRMQRRGFRVDEPNSSQVMQGILTEVRRHNPHLDLKVTEDLNFSTAAEYLLPLAEGDHFFADYLTYKTAEKFQSTYLDKMSRPRLYPTFGYLLETGRTFCSGGFNLQSLPREMGANSPIHTIRGCFVPGVGYVFIDLDFSQIELVTLAFALLRQFGYNSQLACLINSGADVHRLIFARVFHKRPDEVSKEERNSVKPVSFGRPGGLGAAKLKRMARARYGITLSIDEVERRIQAYHELCPELTAFLQDEVNQGQVLAEALHLTPADYCRAIGGNSPDLFAPSATDHVPAGWLGGMLLKVMQTAAPVTRRGAGRSYKPEEIAYFWQKARQLPVSLSPALQRKLQIGQPDPGLWEAVRDWAGRRSVFTWTGRLRANATFCSARNCIFQGLAADGAIMALWYVWRAGYRIVDFVHDQIVVEAPADNWVLARAQHIEHLMKQGMLTVVPGMLVKVETVVSRSLNKADLDPRYMAPQ